MTASDILIDTSKAHILISKTEISEEELAALHKMVDDHGSTLQRLWFLMVDLNNTISTLKGKGDDVINNGFIKVLSNVRDQMALKFGEKGYWK